MVETSLPRLVFGENRSLILTQEQIASAFSVIEGQIQQWALNPAETGWGRGYEFSRVDLVLQYTVPDVPASEIIQSMETMSHPNCRICNRKWTNSGRVNAVYHEGGKMQIKTYDKLLEVTDGEHFGNVFRIEIRLEGRPLQQALGPQGENFPSELSFEECYQAYREILLRFRPTSCRFAGPRTNTDQSPHDVLLDVFAHACRVGLVMPDRRTPLDHLRGSTATAQTLNNYRREIAHRQLSGLGLNWPDLFPEEWPPPHLARTAGQELYRFRGRGT